MNRNKELEEEMIELMEECGARGLQPVSAADVKFVRALKVEIRRLTRGIVYPDGHSIGTFYWPGVVDIEARMTAVPFAAYIAKMYLRESYIKESEDEGILAGLIRWQMGQLLVDAYELYLVLTHNTGKE